MQIECVWSIERDFHNSKIKLIFHSISVIILRDQLCLVPLHDLFNLVVTSIVLEFVFPDNNSRWNILFLAVLNSMAGNTKRAPREVSKNASGIRSKFGVQNTRLSMASATFQRPHSPKYRKSHVNLQKIKPRFPLFDAGT